MPLLTKAQFKQKRPQGVYANYLKYVAANGSPAMKKAAKQALAQQTGGKAQNVPSGPYIDTPALTMPQITAQAGTEAQNEILPAQQEIARQQQIAKDLAAAQAQATQGYSNAANTILQGVAPQITQAYQSAAGAQAGLAQGFAGGLRDTANAEAAQQAAILAKQGAPAAQIQQVQGQTGDAGAGDVLYGTQGYIPGTSLGAQGAAYAAQAAGLPAVNVAYTRDALANQAYQQSVTQRDLSQRAADLAAQIPGLRQKYIQQLMQQEMDKAYLQLAQAQYGTNLQQQGFENEMDVAKFTADQQAEVAKAEADKAKADAAAKKAKTKAERNREIEKARLREAISANENLFLTETHKYPEGDPRYGTVVDTVTKGKLSYALAYKKVLAENATIIQTLRSRYAVRDSVIRELINTELKKHGINPPYRKAPGPG